MHWLFEAPPVSATTKTHAFFRLQESEKEITFNLESNEKHKKFANEQENNIVE